MSITNELRHEVANYPFRDNRDFALFEAIADRIDAKHEACEGFCRRIEEAANERADVTIWGVDYIALPLDADGKTIHFGDTLSQFGTPMVVFAMSDPDPNQGDCMLNLIGDIGTEDVWVRARKMRHHHAPTVEDVLREMADRCYADEDEPRDRDAIVAEYAAKLRLVGDAE